MIFFFLIESLIYAEPKFRYAVFLFAFTMVIIMDRNDNRLFVLSKNIEQQFTRTEVQSKHLQ